MNDKCEHFCDYDSCLNGDAPKALSCQHVDTMDIVFDDRMPLLAHVNCADCRTHWKTYGAEWLVPAARHEVRRWFVHNGLPDPGA